MSSGFASKQGMFRLCTKANASFLCKIGSNFISKTYVCISLWNAYLKASVGKRSASLQICVDRDKYLCWGADDFPSLRALLFFSPQNILSVWREPYLISVLIFLRLLALLYL